MNPSTILALRLTRRAVAAVLVQEETVAFHDGRHLSSRRPRAVATAERYLERMLELLKPTLVVIDAPNADGSTTSQLLQVTVAALTKLGIQSTVVSVPDVLSSYGVPGLKSRTELLRVAERFWPELTAVTAHLKPYIVDAAAVALYMEVQQGLGMASP